MIVAVKGWRGWDDPKFLRKTLDDLWGQHAMFGAVAVPIQFRVSDDDGADAFIREYAAGMDGALLTVYIADWTAMGRSAGPVRTKDMLLGKSLWDPSQGKAADLLLAFPRPDRPGPSARSLTWNAIGQAHYRGIEVRIPAYMAVQS